MGATAVKAFLTYLAIDRWAAFSAHNQVINGLLFLYERG
jgi:hypothetical protein